MTKEELEIQKAIGTLPVRITKISRDDIINFAQNNSLELCVDEIAEFQGSKVTGTQFIAKFSGGSVKVEGKSSTATGRGSTVDDAVRDLAATISCNSLIINETTRVKVGIVQHTKPLEKEE